MYCGKCGEQITEAQEYCGKCGAPVAVESAGAASASQLVADAGIASAKKSRRPIYIAVCIGVLVIAACIALFFWFQADQEDKRVHSMHAVTVELPDMGIDQGGTTIPIAVTGEDADGAFIDETAFLSTGTSPIELMQGSYTVAFPSCVMTAAGDLYTPPTATFEIIVPDDLANGEAFTQVVDASDGLVFTKVEPIDVTDEQIQQAFDYLMRDPEMEAQAEELRQLVVAKREEAIEAKRAQEEEERLAAERQRAAEEAAAKEAQERAYIQTAAAGLNVPLGKPGITYKIDDKTSYWQGVGIYTRYVEFFENGNLVASGYCDADTGEPGHTLMPYVNR